MGFEPTTSPLHEGALPDFRLPASRFQYMAAVSALRWLFSIGSNCVWVTGGTILAMDLRDRADTEEGSLHSVSKPLSIRRQRAIPEGFDSLTRFETYNFKTLAAFVQVISLPVQ